MKIEWCQQRIACSFTWHSNVPRCRVNYTCSSRDVMDSDWPVISQGLRPGQPRVVSGWAAAGSWDPGRLLGLPKRIGVPWSDVMPVDTMNRCDFDGGSVLRLKAGRKVDGEENN